MGKVENVLDELMHIGIEADPLDVYSAYFNLDEIEILYVAKPGDHSGAIGRNPDLLKEIEENRAKIKERPNRYVLIPIYSSDMAYDDMLDFANLQEPEFREELLYELTRSRPFSRFSEIIENNDKLRNQWQGYKYQQRLNFVYEWAKKHNIKAFDN